ncbi:carboxypeptidase 2 [Coccidioides immitis H538.4]|uniref:Carboxypeptidase 1 n=3 Tax=Coccidioides immitis TaxID=5501 RepID=A0A0J8QVQ9_COCIT|nr:carboxypeptidase 2 [Coccidioides immitis RMSCC 2394]KMU76130.1 carboxypeptidase 1 [Coccidioides immitis RMSCC 3703]KMU90647.1 carboxypeptidase 2 [Coccidioides immitis H538.4]
MTVDGKQYGEVGQAGNYSFVRGYEAGHVVQSYQPLASLQIFNRTLLGLDIGSGLAEATLDFETNGSPHATHINRGPSPTPS